MTNDQWERLQLLLPYSPSESEVLVMARRTDGEVTVTVTDRGVGIYLEDLPPIFQRFYKSRGGREAGGLGLGLYVTRMLVEAHGGRIWAESEVGKGAASASPCPRRQAAAAGHRALSYALGEAEAATRRK